MFKILKLKNFFMSKSARKKGISVIQSPNGKEILQFRKFSSSKTKDGKEFEATFDLIKEGVKTKKEIKFLNK